MSVHIFLLSQNAPELRIKGNLQSWGNVSMQCKRKTLSVEPRQLCTKPGVVAHACVPSNGEIETEGSLGSTGLAKFQIQ